MLALVRCDYSQVARSDTIPETAYGSYVLYVNRTQVRS
jgi:hypothetical protein